MKTQCPNCQSYNTLSTTGSLVLLSMGLFFVSIIFLLIFPPLGIVMWLGSVAMFLLPAFVKIFKIQVKHACVDCHNKF